MVSPSSRPAISAPAGAFTPMAAGYAERIRASFAKQGAMRTLGATILAVEPGYCAITLVPRP